MSTQTFISLSNLFWQIVGDVIAGATLYFTIYYGKIRNK